MRCVKSKFSSVVPILVIGVCANVAVVQAGLISEYDFEGNVNNSVSGAPAGAPGQDGTGSSRPTYNGNGPIGGNSLAFTGSSTTTSFVNTGMSGLPNSTDGMAAGSFSYWVATSGAGRNMGAEGVAGASNMAFAVYMNWNGSAQVDGGLNVFLRDVQNHTFNASLHTPDQGWRDGQWHQVTMTWNTPMAGTAASAAIYIDGALQNTDVSTNMLATDTLVAWNANNEIGGYDSYGTSQRFGFNGSMDDVSVWSGVMSVTEAAALYNLGNTLKYNASAANEMFTSTSDVSINGTKWYYLSSGIGGNAGDLNNLGGGNYSLNLGGGAGFTTAVPEPTALTLLGTGVLGLLAYAWRKRKS